MSSYMDLLKNTNFIDIFTLGLSLQIIDDKSLSSTSKRFCRGDPSINFSVTEGKICVNVVLDKSAIPDYSGIVRLSINPQNFEIDIETVGEIKTITETVDNKKIVFIQSYVWVMPLCVIEKTECSARCA